MPDFILYQYPLSPFSEKIRLMLGYSGLSWRAVRVREMPPRPELEILAGGYRKIPVAQIGADIFCDTRTISREIARISGRPELALEGVDEPVREFVRKTDLETFLACVVGGSDLRLLFKLMRQTSIMDTWRFLKDRTAMGRKAKVKPMGKERAQALIGEHVDHLASLLEKDFLFGDTPTIADFAAYHGLWYLCDLARKPVLRKAPAVSAWMDRMRAFGHGDAHPMNSADALTQARENEPRPLPATDHELVGQSVQIAPADYGRDPTEGILVGADDSTWILRRESPQTGPVHVHFPKEGFVLR